MWACESPHMQTKNLIAKCSSTGLYFNGTSFEESNASKATRFSESTTAQDFKLMGWTAPVEMVKLDFTNDQIASYALRIHRGEFDKYGAAKRFVIENGGVAKSGKSHKSYSIRIADGKYVSRKITVPASSRPGESEAWIALYGGQNVLIWSKGELATDW